MSAQTRPLAVVACRVLQSMLEQLLPPGLTDQVVFLDYGLHRVPGKMTLAVQEALDAIPQASLVVLGYGLCGNGLHGVRAGQHTLLVPRTHDCIALLLGSQQAYMSQFEAVPGTIYLSKGWLESGSHPLKEYQEYAAKYGPQEAEWLLDQQYRNYQRLALVASSQAELEHYRPQALEVARFCERWGYRYEEILGSDDYVRRLIQLAGACARGDSAGDGSPDFLVIPPGGQIDQAQFMR